MVFMSHVCRTHFLCADAISHFGPARLKSSTLQSVYPFPLSELSIAQHCTLIPHSSQLCNLCPNGRKEKEYCVYCDSFMYNNTMYVLYVVCDFANVLAVNVL